MYLFSAFGKITIKIKYNRIQKIQDNVNKLKLIQRIYGKHRHKAEYSSFGVGTATHVAAVISIILRKRQPKETAA